MLDTLQWRVNDTGKYWLEIASNICLIKHLQEISFVLSIRTFTLQYQFYFLLLINRQGW